MENVVDAQLGSRNSGQQQNKNATDHTPLDDCT